MSNDKIECEKCHKKFLILNREQFNCVNCNNLIIIKKNSNTSNIDNLLDEDLDIDEIIDDESLDLDQT